MSDSSQAAAWGLLDICFYLQTLPQVFDELEED